MIERLDERQAALPVMERIHELTGETVFLCVRRGDEAVCIERIDGQRVQSLALRLGGSLPLHAGAAPRVLLAWEPRSEWEAFFERHSPLEQYTDRTPLTREQLFAELEQTVERGYAVSDEDVTPGISSLGAPVFDYTGRIRAAISIGGTRQLLLEDMHDESIRMLVDGACEVSAALGHGTAVRLRSPRRRPTGARRPSAPSPRRPPGLAALSQGRAPTGRPASARAESAAWLTKVVP